MKQIFNEDYLVGMSVLMVGSLSRTNYSYHIHRRWTYIQLLLEGEVPHKEGSPDFQDYVDFVGRIFDYDVQLKLFFPRNV